MHAGACIPCAPPRRLKATSVISRDCMHLLRCQLPRDRAHLLADVVLAHALSEGQQLAFDTVTGGAWRDAACGRLDGYTRVRQIPERAQEGRDAARPSAASWQIGSRIYWRPSLLLGELEIKPESLRYIVCSTRELLEDSSVNIERGSWTRRGGRLRFRLTTRFWWATVSASQWEFLIRKPASRMPEPARARRPGTSRGRVS